MITHFSRCYHFSEIDRTDNVRSSPIYEQKGSTDFYFEVGKVYENKHLIELPGGILFDDSPEALLAELIDDGWTGDALLAEFKRRAYEDLPEFRNRKS